jgi:putative acetyltransferase
MASPNPIVTIQVDDPLSPEAFRLIEELDRYLTGLYPPESNHLLSPESLREPRVSFLTARVDGQAVGCGALVNHDGQFAEIKRIYVSPRCRGLNIGRSLLAALESLARAAGLEWARLETGIAQPEALALFEKAGYRRRPPFDPYPEDPLCVFMEKNLEEPT